MREEMMSTHCLFILSLILSQACISTQASSCDEEVPLMELEQKLLQARMKATSHQSSENGVTTGLKPWKGLGQSSPHHGHYLKNMHGVLNIIGWGTLLPVGIIVARYFRKFPWDCEEWYSLHALCQTTGYITGAIGWSIGMWLGHSSKFLKTHRVLAIVIFTLSTIQILALCLQPKRDNECRKWWKIYHHVLGYALAAMSIINIFEGIGSLTHGEKWRWVYVGILGVLALVAIALELHRWISKYRIQQQMPLEESDMYTSSTHI